MFILRRTTLDAAQQALSAAAASLSDLSTIELSAAWHTPAAGQDTSAQQYCAAVHATCEALAKAAQLCSDVSDTLSVQSETHDVRAAQLLHTDGAAP